MTEVRRAAVTAHRYHRRRAWVRGQWKAAAWGLVTIGVLATGIGLASMHGGGGVLAFWVTLVGVALIAVAAWAGLRAEAAGAPVAPFLASRPAHGQAGATSELDAAPTMNLVEAMQRMAAQDPQFRAALAQAVHRHMTRQALTRRALPWR